MIFSRDTYVEVYPFSRQQDGEELVIGRVDTNSFLSLSREAVQVLDDLAAGRTVGETQQLYWARHGETPDLEDFLEQLSKKGLVWPCHPEGATKPEATRRFDTAPPMVHYHFTNVSRELASKLFGRLALTCYGLLIGLGAVTILLDPGVVPSREALYFVRDKTLKMLVLSVISYSSIFVHEMGHLLAARAAGVNSRLGIGHRLWALVAETDMTGLWSVPRKQRFLPIVAGPLTDILSGSLLLVILFAARRNWLGLPIAAADILRALVFVYMMRLLWQCFFFVRTDLYFLLATLFGCKSLMLDTRIMVTNFCSRFFKSIRKQDQSYLTGMERKAVRCYVGFWLVGRMVAFASLFLVTLPVMAHYLMAAARAIAEGPSHGLYRFLDSLIVTVLPLLPLGIGLTLWLRSLLTKVRSSNERKAYA